MQYPGVELLKFDPIFVPQRVRPGSIQDYLQKLAEQEQEENLEEENPQEEQKDQKEQTKPQDKAENKGTSPPQIPPSPALPPIQTMPIEVPSLVEDEDDSIPEPELEGVITVQVLGIPVPMPEPEILVAAGATATVSVAATLASIEYIKKSYQYYEAANKKNYDSDSEEVWEEASEVLGSRAIGTTSEQTIENGLDGWNINPDSINCAHFNARTKAKSSLSFSIFFAARSLHNLTISPSNGTLNVA